MDCFYYIGKLFEPAALFFHPQMWGKYPIVSYFLLSDVVSKPFLKTAVSYFCWSLFPLLDFFVLFCIFLQQLFLFLSYQDTGLDGDLLEEVRMGTVLLVKHLIYDPPPPIIASAIVCLSLLEHLWLFCEHKTGGMSVCSPLHSPMVRRHRSITYTVATALSCSNKVEFGTRIIFCTKASCICTNRLLWSCFLRAQWLLVFSAVLPLHLGY